MMLGYARVSTEEQNLDLQKDAGCESVFVDKVSGQLVNDHCPCKLFLEKDNPSPALRTRTEVRREC